MTGADIVAPMALRQLLDAACSLLQSHDRPRNCRVEVLDESSRSCCLRVRVDYLGPADGVEAEPSVAVKSNHIWCSTNLCCSHKTCRVVPAGEASPGVADRVVTRTAYQVWRRTRLRGWVQEPVGSRLYDSYCFKPDPRAASDLDDHWKDRQPRRVIRAFPGIADG